MKMTLLTAVLLSGSIASASASATTEDEKQFLGKFTVDQAKCSYVNYPNLYVRAYVSKKANSPDLDIQYFGDEARLDVLVIGEKSFPNPNGENPVKTIIQNGAVTGNKLVSKEIYVYASGKKEVAEVQTLTNTGKRLILDVYTKGGGAVANQHCELVRVR